MDHCWLQRQIKIGRLVISRPAENIAIVVVYCPSLANFTLRTYRCHIKKRKLNDKGRSPARCRRTTLAFNKGAVKQNRHFGRPSKKALFEPGVFSLFSVWLSGNMVCRSSDKRLERSDRIHHNGMKGTRQSNLITLVC